MTRFIQLFALLGVAVAVLAMPGKTLAEGYGQQKVVYHINYTGGDDNKAYTGAMRNIQNHIDAVGADNMEVRVVLHGNGVGLLQAAKGDPTMQTVVSGLKEQKVKFNVCNNTLTGRNIDYSNDLYDVWEDDIVPSGVAELSKLQIEGFTYIKP
ncbi:DsrE family protein [Maliponia aquimaris]|uniref:DsrE/DsrF-like family protein n=1 Tax=Maliponia aquimaris TaxID=1673631 RepID=A0A238JN78_9RHOB|nr:DsrE family protein [Maliponia aquimaris]SMX32091.1 DsrE/DsrF-like family protein [Maliponia aquimaris]